MLHNYDICADAYTTGMAFNGTHTSAMTVNVAKLLLLNTRSRAEYGGAPT